MDVITIGESMVLFTPKTSGLMRYAGDYSSKVAGAESNVAIGLARLGHQAGWISRLGEDEFGTRIHSFIRGEGVDVSQVHFDDSASTGLYFKEKITPDELRVAYYRKHSAASLMTPADLKEAYISQAAYLHVTGITPALSEGCYETVLEAMEMARRNRVTIVFDPNLRRKLWEDSHARKVLRSLASKADVVLPGWEEAQFIFGESSPEKLASAFYEEGASHVVMKLGKEGAYVYSEQSKGFVEGFPVNNVLDPVGAGDGFAAGCISGMIDGLDWKACARRGNGVGAMATLVEGDVEGLPDKDRLRDFMDQREKDDVDR